VTGCWILLSFPHTPWRATLMCELFRLQIVGKIKKRHAVKCQTPAICCSYMQATKRYIKICKKQSCDIRNVSHCNSEVMGGSGRLVTANLHLTIMMWDLTAELIRKYKIFILPEFTFNGHIYVQICVSFILQETLLFFLVKRIASFTLATKSTEKPIMWFSDENSWFYRIKSACMPCFSHFALNSFV